MKIGIPKEVFPGEKRVAITPENVEKFKKLGFEVLVEAGAGAAAHYLDQEYQSAGATLVTDAPQLWQSSDIIFKVRAPDHHTKHEKHESEWLDSSKTLISFIWPAQHPDLMTKLASRKATVLAMDCVPRISRAQKLDALSSMANIAGYRAVIEAAQHFGRFFTGQITAAGKVPPAKVMVIGAGVAGLAAIGTAVGLGAIVRAFDTRPEVKDQVKSMGAEFLELNFNEDGSGVGGYAKQMSPEFIKAEMELFAKQAREVDIVITTALIPGKPAPKLLPADVVELLKPGSVVVDLAAEQGGNCEWTKPGEVVVKNNISIVGYTDLPSRMAKQSSQLYSTNIFRLLEELCPQKDGKISLNFDDVVHRGTTVIRNGQVTWPPPPVAVSAAAVITNVKASAGSAPTAAKPQKSIYSWLPLVLVSAFFVLIAAYAPPPFVNHFTVFVLSCFVGYMVIWNVSASLHTPLMSVTNAISGIIAIGAVLQISSENKIVAAMAAVAVLVATINIAGGFLVTHRMLKMFRR